MIVCICNEVPHHHECPLSHEPYNPDINADTTRVMSPAPPDGEVDWRKIGELIGFGVDNNHQRCYTL
jgi:hypothetical protein